MLASFSCMATCAVACKSMHLSMCIMPHLVCLVLPPIPSTSLADSQRQRARTSIDSGGGGSLHGGESFKVRSGYLHGRLALVALRYKICAVNNQLCY